MNHNRIICPYCFAQFEHTEVHFRMETYFTEDELNEEGYQEDEVHRMADSPTKRKLMDQIRKRKPFLRRDDEAYETFWRDYGKSTERTTGVDRKLPFPVQQLPVLDPGDEAVQSVLQRQRQSGSGGAEDYFIYDGDGTVVAVKDIYGHETHRRVCPECHNPLPLGYGKYEPKFISVIGVTGAGKTVYISQLLKNMNKYAAYVNMSAYFTSDHEPNFIEDNPVEVGKPLPRATMEGQMSQPMFYDLIQSGSDDRVHCNTIVLYDIAGESCKTAAAMQKYGKFVTKSDGIILLVDPTQLELVVDSDLTENARNAEPALVLNTIHTAFVAKNSQQKQDIPVAVCISKSDSFEQIFSDVGSRDIAPVVDKFTGENQSKFNAAEYNQLEPEIVKLLRNNPMMTNLRNGYKNFNFFIFSATGCGVKRPEKAGGLSYPLAPPVPKRIAEPLLWMFYKFGYIHSSEPIRLPYARSMPEFVTEPAKGLKGIFGGTVNRPLTEEEKQKYLFEEFC